MDKGYVDNFDVIVIQMWRYMKIKEYQERDWKEAQNILNEARDKVGSLVSENTYSWISVGLNLIKNVQVALSKLRHFSKIPSLWLNSNPSEIHSGS